MRGPAIPSLVLLLGAGSLAAQGAAPLRVTRLGSHKVWGPGIASATIRQVQFELAEAAHVIVLRVHPDGGIEPLVPQQAGDVTERSAGVHVVDAPEAPRVAADGMRPLEPILSPGTLVRVGTPARPPAAGADAEAGPSSYWWLVIVSDTGTTLPALLDGIDTFRRRTFTSVEAEVRALPRELLPKRAGRWAAYYVHVEP